MNVGVQGFLWPADLDSLGIWLDYMGVVSTLESLHIYFHIGCTSLCSYQE